MAKKWISLADPEGRKGVGDAPLSIFCRQIHIVWRDCDAGAGMVERIFCSKSTVYPILGLPKIPLPPNDLMKIVRDFGSELAKNTLS